MRQYLGKRLRDRVNTLSRAVMEVARRLAIGPADLGQIIGVSQSTASQLMRGAYTLQASHNESELSPTLVRFFDCLTSLVGGDDDLARGWLWSPNTAFSGEPPIDVIKRIDGLIHVCEYLEARRDQV